MVPEYIQIKIAMIQKPVTLKFDEFCFQNCTNLNFTRFSEAIISIWLDLGFNPNNMKKKDLEFFCKFDSIQSEIFLQIFWQHCIFAATIY